jgi:hypothetical protein
LVAAQFREHLPFVVGVLFVQRQLISALQRRASSSTRSSNAAHCVWFVHVTTTTIPGQ